MVDWVGVSRLFSYFNHSCAPNASWIIDGTGEEMIVLTEKRINEYDEIYISYSNEEDAKKDVHGRRAALRPILGCECSCPRCIEELKTGNNVLPPELEECTGDYLDPDKMSLDSEDEDTELDEDEEEDVEINEDEDEDEDMEVDEDEDMEVDEDEEERN